jgi:hypothetical protein
MTKEDFLDKTKHEFDCEHDWILARMFVKEENKWVDVIPEDNNNRLKILLTLIPKETITNGLELPVQWISEEKDLN